MKSWSNQTRRAVEDVLKENNLLQQANKLNQRPSLLSISVSPIVPVIQVLLCLIKLYIIDTKIFKRVAQVTFIF